MEILRAFAIKGARLSWRVCKRRGAQQQYLSPLFPLQVHVVNHVPSIFRVTSFTILPHRSSWCPPKSRRAKASPLVGSGVRDGAQGGLEHDAIGSKRKVGGVRRSSLPQAFAHLLHVIYVGAGSSES